MLTVSGFAAPLASPQFSSAFFLLVRLYHNTRNA